jgi:nucleotide-binding universal stress UspA family protein
MTRQTPRVLLAASGSEASRRATVVAADLASTFEAPLTILHAVAPTAYRVGRLAPTLPITRRLDDPLSNAVLLEARRVAWARGANVSTILIAGDRRDREPDRRRPAGHRHDPSPRAKPHGRQDATLGARPGPVPGPPGHG